MSPGAIARKANSELMLGLSVVAFFVAVVAALGFVLFDDRARIGDLEDPAPRQIVSRVQVSIDACLEDPACRRKVVAAVERIGRQGAANRRARARRAGAGRRSSSPTSTSPTSTSPTSRRRSSPTARTSPPRRPRRPGSSSPTSSSPQPAPTPAPRPSPSVAGVDAPLIPAQACTGVIDVNCR